MNPEQIIDEIFAPLMNSPEGAVAVAHLKQAVKDCLAAGEALHVDWSLALAAMLPKLVKLMTGIQA